MMMVKLTWPEVLLAAQAGAMRNVESLRRGDIHLADYDGPGWDNNVLGVLGEMAVCKAFGVYWKPTVNAFKDADVGDRVEVRARHRHNHDLIVRPRDNNKLDRKFLLVTGEPPVLCVRGWRVGSECRRPEWWKEYGGRPPAWFVPQSALADPELLKITPLELAEFKSVEEVA